MWVCLLSSGFYLLNVILSVLVGGVYASPDDDWRGILLFLHRSCTPLPP